MKIRFLPHAEERMRVYGISKDAVIQAVEEPDRLERGHSNRWIAQKRLNHYVLRVIYEDLRTVKTVVTVYKARRGRYEIQL